jgi:hypothetical protein
MNCSEIKEFLIAQTFGDLSAEQEAELDKHLALCSECRQEREGILKLKGALQSQRITDPGDAFWRELSISTLERIRAQQASLLRGIYHFVFSPKLAYAVGVVGCLFLFVYMFNHYLLPLSFPKDEPVVQRNNAPETALYQEMADELLTGAGPAYSVWDLDTVGLNEFSQWLSAQIKIGNQVDEWFAPAIGYSGEEGIYQLIDQLDTEELDYIYQSLKVG